MELKTDHMSIPMRGIKDRHGSWLAVVVMLNDLVLGSTPCIRDEMIISDYTTASGEEQCRPTSQAHPEP